MSLRYFSYYRTVWVWAFQNATPRALFILSQLNFMKILLAMGEYKMFLLLGNPPSLCQFYYHF